jgi:transcriptional regulator with XRE-family HTH domain
MDISLIIRRRLTELGLEQRDLAAAAQVTESYISQLLTRRKAPPAPGRTDLYDKLEDFLKLPEGELSSLAEFQRKEDLKRKVADPPKPLFEAFRELIVHKCEPSRQSQIRAIFEKEPFGALERLVTQKLLDVAKRVAKEELGSEQWLHLVARLSGQRYEQMRVTILEFLDTDVSHVSPENCISFLSP